MKRIDMAVLTRPRLWLIAVATVAVAAMVLLPLGSSIGAQEATGDPRVIDPADPCSIPAPPVAFSDRGDIAEVHLPNVDCAFAQGITLGAGDGNSYAPRSAVRRDQMASFIIRTLQAAGGINIPTASNQGFSDISGNTHEDAINQLAALGITTGRTPTQYAPAELVRRDQMASFIMRAAGIAFGTTFEAVGTSPFVDVSGTNVHRQNIEAGFEIFGLTVGQTSTTFAPGQGVRRDQMATFLIRLLDVTELTDEGTGSSSQLPIGGGLVDDLTDLVDNLLGAGGSTGDTQERDGLLDTLTDAVLPLSAQDATSDTTSDTTPTDVDEASTDDEEASAPDGDSSEGGGLLNRILP